MGKATDKLHQIRLTPENDKKLKELHAAMPVKSSIVSLVNFILLKYGFPEFQKHDPLAGSVRLPVEKAPWTK